MASLLLAQLRPSTLEPRCLPFQSLPLFIPHRLSRPPFSQPHLQAPTIPGTQAWFFSIFTPLGGSKDPVSPAARVWKDGRHSQGVGSNPGELRESSDLVPVVLVDPQRPHFLCSGHTGLLPGPQTHQAHSCLMAFAPAVLSAWNAEVRSSQGGFLLTLFLAQMSPSQKNPSLAVPQLYSVISSFSFYSSYHNLELSYFIICLTYQIVNFQRAFVCIDHCHIPSFKNIAWGSVNI